MLLFLGFPFGVAFFAPPAYSPLSLSPLVTSLGGQGCSPPSLVAPVVFALGEFLSVAAVLCLLFLLLLGVLSALAEPPWCVCSTCLGTHEVFPLGVMWLAALLGFPCWLILYAWQAVREALLFLLSIWWS